MKLLEELLENFCEEKNLLWWEIFDNELFDKFLKSNHVDTTKEFQAWYKVMLKEL